MIYKNKKHLITQKFNKNDIVLDIGFWGQGVDINNKNWPHNILKENTKELYGIDLTLDEEFLKDKLHYRKQAAENVDFNIQFDKIFAGDLIEHLINPGLFLSACKKVLKKDGELILTTPNTFNLFNLIEKITKYDPTVNSDHTFYFNHKVIKVLLEKCDFEVVEMSYLYKLDVKLQESWKKKFLNIIYFFLSKFTDKFIETIVVVAKVKNIYDK